MEKKKRKPVLIQGPPITPEENSKIFKLSKKTVSRLKAMVDSNPALNLSDEEIIRRYSSKSVASAR